METKLYRSTTDKRLGGVCGGLGDYFHVDSTLIRIAWAGIAIITLPFGPGGLVIGGLAYAACRLIIPVESGTEQGL